MLTKLSNQGPPLVGVCVGQAPFNDIKTRVRKIGFQNMGEESQDEI